MAYEIVTLYYKNRVALPQILEINLESSLAGKLFRKKSEYLRRYKNPEYAYKSDAIHKKEVLEIFLKKGYADILNTATQVATKLKEDFNMADFENAWGVLSEYISRGYAGGGTGLPKD